MYSQMRCRALWFSRVLVHPLLDNRGGRIPTFQVRKKMAGATEQDAFRKKWRKERPKHGPVWSIRLLKRNILCSYCNSCVKNSSNQTSALNHLKCQDPASAEQVESRPSSLQTLTSVGDRRGRNDVRVCERREGMQTGTRWMLLNEQTHNECAARILWNETWNTSKGERFVS